MFAVSHLQTSDQPRLSQSATCRRSCGSSRATRSLCTCLVATFSLWFFQSSACAQIKVACIGDSITYGHGLPDPNTQSYPAVLGGLLGEGYDVQKFAVGGATMLKDSDNPYWDTQAFIDSTAWAPDIVIIMLGTADSKPWNWVHGDEYEGDYLDMIAHYAALGSAPVIYICTPCPVYEHGSGGVSPRVVAYQIVPLVWLVGAESGTPVIDVFTALSDLPQDFPDYVHPNARGATLIALTVWRALTAGE